MAEIKFAKDYGYAPGSPFWIVWHQDSYEDDCRPSMTKHDVRDKAEDEAAELAAKHPGRTFHVLAAMATISTSTEVVGRRFNSDRSATMAVEREYVEAPAPPVEALEPF